MTEENKVLICRWFEEVWNKGRSETIDELMDENCMEHGLSNASGNLDLSKDGFKKYHETFKQSFSDIQVEVEDIIAEGDKVAARCSVSGYHTGDSLGIAPCQKNINITGITIIRVINGKIVEGWNNYDFMALFQQISSV